MERTRLKLAVIFLLAALNVVLLGYVLLQAQQSKDYEDLTRRQIDDLSDDHGIAALRNIIPWDDGLAGDRSGGGEQQHGGRSPPGGGSAGKLRGGDRPERRDAPHGACRGLSDLGVSAATIQSIETGYRYAGEGDRGVLTPMWKLETSGQSYYLNCATGEVTLPTE